MGAKMATLSDLENAVREYCARYHIKQFEISDAYDLHKQWQDDYFPHTDSAGCYAFFTEGGDLLYVGKASCGNSLGHRIATYLKWNKSSGELDRTGSWHWTGEPKILRTIPVHEAHQAPSLEEYLIERLHPPENRAGRKG